MSERWIRGLGFVALIVYSISLITIEVRVSQEFADNFFTDIRGPVRLYAVNTTLSVAFLWATALIFAVCVLCTEEGRQRERLFYLSQVLVFGFLGLDDRFMLHELIGIRLGVNDALILLSMGVLEVILLLTLGNLRGQSNESKYYIGAAALFFCTMAAIDGLVPREAVPRLSLEDLSKTWAGVFLFLFAWSICRDKIHTLKQKAGSTTSDHTKNRQTQPETTGPEISN